MTPRNRILVVDDDRTSCLLLAEILGAEGYDVVTAQSAEEALQLCEQTEFDLVLSDIRMVEMDGLGLLRHLKSKHPDQVVILVTGFASVETAIEAIQAGAFDYVSKPFKLDEMKLTVRRALEHWRQLRHPTGHPGEAAESEGPGSVLGRSRAMLDVFKNVARVAPAKNTVLIQGETGTGKEVIARTIHFHSPRAGKPFLAVNCASLPETLLESELFGHARGAFTNAYADKEGLFERASLGTLFLDEIGDTTLGLQAKLLRVIEDEQVTRVGGTEPRKVDVRIITATNRDLNAMIAQGRFREDLYYRLNVVRIVVPPLRERREDIPVYAQHFLARMARQQGRKMGLSDEALELLKRYDWPGNVRELLNVIERAVALNPKSLIVAEDLPAAMRESPHPSLKSLEDLEKEHIARVLQETGGNRQEAAQILGIDRKTLYRKAIKYGIQIDKP
jgi:DNA-binding NtrC family response regulator